MKAKTKDQQGKVLYFEGAGRDGTGGAVGNCRIRTALTNDEGLKYYVELGGWTRGDQWHKNHPEFKGVKYVMTVDTCREISGDKEALRWAHEEDRNLEAPYTLNYILKYVNERLGCSFERVCVLPFLGGYQVHTGQRGVYRFGDEFVYERALAMRAQEIEEREMSRQREAGEKYPCVSVWRDDGDIYLLHVKHNKKCGLEDFDCRLDVD